MTTSLKKVDKQPQPPKIINKSISPTPNYDVKYGQYLTALCTFPPRTAANSLGLK